METKLLKLVCRNSEIERTDGEIEHQTQIGEIRNQMGHLHRPANPDWIIEKSKNKSKIESSIKEIEPDDDEIAKSVIELKPFNRVFESSSIASCPAA